MSGFIVASGSGKRMYVPTSDLDYVQQATLSLAQRLCLKSEESSPYIQLLEKDHEGISKACKETLERANTKPKQSKPWTAYCWKAAMIPLSMGVAAIASRLLNLPMKTMLTVGAIVGLVLAYTVANTPEKDDFITEIQIRATTERLWMKAKLAAVAAKVDALEATIKNHMTTADYDANIAIYTERNQLLPLQAFLNSRP